MRARAPPRSFIHLMEFASAGAEAKHRRTPHVMQFVEELYPLCDVKPQFIGLKEIARSR